jgi:hypothetical protein
MSLEANFDLGVPSGMVSFSSSIFVFFPFVHVGEFDFATSLGVMPSAGTS